MANLRPTHCENCANKVKEANPFILGCFGLGLNSIMSSMHALGAYKASVMTLSMEIMCGGLAQIIAGMLERKRGNTDAFIILTLFGFFWITKAIIDFLPLCGVGSEPDDISMGLYLFIWGSFTIVMYISSLKETPYVVQILILKAAILFWLSAISHWSGSHIATLVAGA